jgi:hypothetical protein
LLALSPAASEEDVSWNLGDQLRVFRPRADPVLFIRTVNDKHAATAGRPITLDANPADFPLELSRRIFDEIRLTPR